MSWKPDLTPCVCPFCTKACDVPEFNAPFELASCQCGAMVAAMERDEIFDSVEEFPAVIERRIVQKVDFLGPLAGEGEEPRDGEGPWDGDWVDAVFYKSS